MTTPAHPQRCYLAGSWKNQAEILLIRDILKSQGHEVDCFASEDTGRISFNWSKLDDIQDKLPSMDAKDMLSVKRVQEAFIEDKKWLDWCNLCILILPSGKSAHLEAGYAKGQNKTLVIFGDLQKGDFDVMYGFADAIYRCDEIDLMIDFVNSCASHSSVQSRDQVLDEENIVKMIERGVKIGEQRERDKVLDILKMEMLFDRAKPWERCAENGDAELLYYINVIDNLSRNPDEVIERGKREGWYRTKGSRDP